MALMGLQFPANRISGRLGGNSNVNTWNNGQQVLRTFTAPSNPDTPDQQAVKVAFSLLTKNWKNLSDAVTDAWNEFAALNPIVNRLGNTVPRTGLSAYVELGSIHYYRTGSLLSAAPTLTQPPPATSISLQSGQTPGNLDIIITHSLPSVTNIWWLIRMTDALASSKVTPAFNLYRMVKGVGSGSFVAAAASPDTVNLTTVKYTIQDGQYIGVEVQAVNIEGWASTPIRLIDQFVV